VTRRDPLPGEGADQLIKRVMAADILAREKDAAPRQQKARRMERLRHIMERLETSQCIGRPRRFKAVKERTLAFEHGERTERLFKAVDAAKAAAERAQHGPSSLENNITPVIAQPEACLDPVRVRDDLQRFDLIRMLNEPL